MTVPAPFEGVAWTLSATTDLGVGLGDVEVTALFEAGRVAGGSGCNRYTGGYAVDGESLTIAPGLVTTMMACPEAQMAVERAFLGRLAQVTAFVVDGSRLTLVDAAGAGLLVFEHVPPERALAGDWEVTALRTADAVASPIAGSGLTLSFDGERLSGNTGCNRLDGRFTATGTRLELGPLATTRRACLDADLARQEQDFLAALAGTAAFSATRSQLTLLADDGTIRVTLARA